jgi:hypothetical protein
MRRLREILPGELDAALDLLRYCGLFRREGDAVRLTPLGVWAVRQDLLREGHDAPLLSEIAGFAELSAVELVEAMLSGQAPSSAPTLWVERRAAEDAARELIKVAASGTAGQRGVIGTVLEEMGPEAEPAMREALAEPTMWRHAAVWLGVRDLDAPALSEDDGTWLAVDTLATLLHIPDVQEAMGEFEALEPGDELLRLIEDVSHSTHADAMAVLDLLASRHPDATVAKAARKACRLDQPGTRRQKPKSETTEGDALDNNAASTSRRHGTSSSLDNRGPDRCWAAARTDRLAGSYSQSCASAIAPTNHSMAAGTRNSTCATCGQIFARRRRGTQIAATKPAA